MQGTPVSEGSARPNRWIPLKVPEYRAGIPIRRAVNEKLRIKVLGARAVDIDLRDVEVAVLKCDARRYVVGLIRRWRR